MEAHQGGKPKSMAIVTKSSAAGPHYPEIRSSNPQVSCLQRTRRRDQTAVPGLAPMSSARAMVADGTGARKARQEKRRMLCRCMTERSSKPAEGDAEIHSGDWVEVMENGRHALPRTCSAAKG